MTGSQTILRSPQADISRIEGRACYLQPFGDAHLADPAYLGWLRDPEVVKTLGRAEYLTPVPFAEVEAYVRQITASEDDLFFALHMAEDDAFVGTVKAGHINRAYGTADIGVMIGSRAHWGRGLATDAFGTLSRWMFDDFGCRKLTGGAMANNPGMLRVFEKLGYRREAVLRRHVPFDGDYVDHILYGCFPDELSA